MRRLVLVWLVCLAVLAAAPAFATYSGLLIIPTAETVGADQYSIEVQMDGDVSEATADGWLLNTQFGFGERFEAGLDFDLSSHVDEGARLLLNWKYLPLVDNRRRFCVAIGVFNTHPQHRSTPYLVTTWDASLLRVHGGLQRCDGTAHWLVGADRAFDRLTLMADYTEGSENFASAGFNYQFSDVIGLMAGLLFPNDGSKTGFTIHLVIGGSYR